ncbi:hypothetical protein [Brevibacillus marinus]|uniref:hypothetical protein n=1 Tax=Brevibacillus marinus TaxID=2496837 RepID=UPI000F84A929|nr:hypothetical protein [Brevibacillus marinus]
MNSDFIRLKNLEGELKLTQMNRSFSCSVTSKELVLQKPHITYHLFLSDILSIIPISAEQKRLLAFRHLCDPVGSGSAAHSYKIAVKWARIITRSGVAEREEMEFIVPLSNKMLQYIAAYSGLTVIP